MSIAWLCDDCTRHLFADEKIETPTIGGVIPGPCVGCWRPGAAKNPFYSADVNDALKRALAREEAKRNAARILGAARFDAAPESPRPLTRSEKECLACAVQRGVAKEGGGVLYTLVAVSALGADFVTAKLCDDHRAKLDARAPSLANELRAAWVPAEELPS